MRQHQDELQVMTRGPGAVEITEDVHRFVQAAAMQTGLLTLHVLHTSASLMIQENADPQVLRDMEAFMSRLVPAGDPLFRHTAEGPDDMPAHVRAALTGANLSIPVRDGRLCLGTWQGIYLYEHRDVGHRRRLVLHQIGEG